MNKIWSVLLLTGALFSSCSTELDINADWEEKTIVYSIINRNQTEHFIRIHKAFLDPAKGALAVAPIKDSLYFQQADVIIEQIKNNAVVATFNCSRLDTNAIVPGPFAYPDQTLYRFYTPAGMDSSCIYRLKITTPGGNIITSEISPIGGYQSRNAEQTIFPPNTATFQQFQGLNWSSQAPFRVAFRAPRNAKSYNLLIRVIYNEWPTAGNIADSVVKTVDWKYINQKLFTNVNTNESVEDRIYGRDLFGFMRSAIPVDPSVSRRMRGVAFFLSFADESLTNFLTLNTSSQSATDIRPEYTNINNGLGIYGTIYSLPEKSSIPANNPYQAFSYRSTAGGVGTDSLRARYPELNFIP